jgi:hypothetical protein
MATNMLGGHHVTAINFKGTIFPRTASPSRLMRTFLRAVYDIR